MFEVNRTELADQARTMNFVRDTLEMVLRLTEILNYLCDELIDNDLATKAYKEDVFKREAVSATSFMYGFAVPHSIEVSTKKSCISVLILDRSVKWGEFDVKFIILLGIRETDNIVESLGVEKSKEMIKKADLVLILVSGYS